MRTLQYKVAGRSERRGRDSKFRLDCIEKKKQCHELWQTSVIQASGEQRQGDCQKFKAILACTESLYRLARTQ